MSELGNFLKATIDRSTRPAYEFAAHMGLDPTHLSGFISGRRPSCNIETLAKMVSGISDDPAVQAGLLQAYFRDQTPLPEMKDWVTVASPTRLTDKPGKYRVTDEIALLDQLLRTVALPTDYVRALHTISEAAPGHTALQELVTDLADFTKDALSPRVDNRPKTRAKKRPARN